MKRFRITFTYEDVFTADQIWPDGDAPPNPDPLDVRRLFDELGGSDQARSALNVDEPYYGIEVVS